MDKREELSDAYKLIRGDDVLYSSKLIIAQTLFLIKRLERLQFKELNSKFYSSYPLQIDMILKGEKIEKEKYKFYILQL